MKARVSEWAIREASWLGREEAVPEEGEGVPGWRNGARESSCGVICLEPEHRGCALTVLGSDHRTYRVLLPESTSFTQTRKLRLWKLGD